MKKKSNFFSRILRVFLVIVLVITLCALVIGLSLSIYIDRNMEKEIDEEIFSMVGSGTSSEVFYYDFEDRENQEGEAIRLENEELFGGYRCIYVKYDDIPKNLIDAFVSIEDKRFFSHNGVDWKRTASATLNYFLNFKGNFGGSTITQQLIKNVTDRDEYSFQRKLQ